MIGEHFFWWLLTMSCVVWYLTITIYVAIRGWADIKTMLKHLGDISDDSPHPPSTPPQCR